MLVKVPENWNGPKGAWPPGCWAIDPGKKQCAAALFLNRELWAVDFVVRAQSGIISKPAAKGELIVIEQPVSYPNSPVDPNDLIEIAVMGAEVAGRFIRPGGKIVHVKPNEWKGTVPKEITAARTREILSDIENVRMDEWLSKHKRGIRHNLLDAVGIGLFTLGRAGRGMVKV